MSRWAMLRANVNCISWQARATAILAPLANPTTTVAPLQAAFKATETSARSLQAAVAGVEVSINGELFARSTGRSKKEAEQAAARIQALGLDAQVFKQGASE